MKSMFQIIATLACALALTACGGSDDDPVTTPAPEIVVKTDLAVGTGVEAIAGDTVTVAYTLWLYDKDKADGKGTEIEKVTADSPFTFLLGKGANVIVGWDQGIPGMRQGGKRRLLVPASLAYGQAGRPPAVPANTALVFDVEMLAIKR